MDSQLFHGRYQVIKELGAGAMGSVYLARDMDEGGQKVALKVLDAPDFDADSTKRFQQEVRVSDFVEHPNLVKISDIFYVESEMILGRELKKKLAYSMEYIEGRPLDVHNDSVRYFIDDIFVGILDGLGALHKRGITHRDIKAPNVMVREDDGQPIIIDFGLIKWKGGSIHTKPGVMLGTVQYFAPEYARQGKCTPQADIYAVGILLLELLTREYYYDKTTLKGAELLKHLLKRNFAIPRELLQNLAPKYKCIILKATQPDPKDRYQDVQEMITDFSRPEEELKEELVALEEVAVAASKAAATVPNSPSGGWSSSLRDFVLITAAAMVLVSLMGVAAFFIR